VRRVAAIVLPDLACEIVRQRVPVSGPLGVIFEELGGSTAAPPATAVLDAVDAEARRVGVKPGQRVVEASALAARLAVHRVTFDELESALGCVAEIALTFGPTAAVRLARDEGASGVEGAAFDTVWLDITGSAHLVGGEEPLLEELLRRVAELGYSARAGVADGPRIAQALARFGGSSGGRGGRGGSDSAKYSIASEGEGASAIAPLPVRALPIDADVLRFLGQLGITTVGDLARLPSAAVAARLGPYAAVAMSLIRGVDDAPLCPYEPPRALEEESTFEEGVESTESLLFVLRGMTSRTGARLKSRGEACAAIDVVIPYDRAIARLRVGERGEKVSDDELALRLHIDLPAPLSDAADLFRAIRTKLERSELCAPAVGLRLELSQITIARVVQLDLSRDVAVDPDRLPALLAELSAEIGPERVGTLAIVDAHRPEARSELTPAEVEGPGSPPPEDAAGGPGEPTRLLLEPVSIGRVQQGAVVVIDGRRYVVERLTFEMRLHAVEWWTSSPVSRDYARAWLIEKPDARGGGGAKGRRGAGLIGAPGDAASAAPPCGEALIFVDRATGEGFLQGWSE
jgi:protein ImuB